MRKGNVGLIVGILIAVALLIAGYFGIQVLLRPAPMQGPKTTFSNAPADFDRSGSVDEVDRQMVQTNIGCAKIQTCWSDVVGKTKDGDNPIYVSDLDLNKDNTINQQDLDLVK